jgi:hypothetical protein
MTDRQTSDRDVTRAIRSWLHEDRHEDASRIAGAVLDRVETTHERRATWWPARRTPTMNRIVGIGLVAAAVVAIALVGFQLLGSPGGFGAPGVEATATPEPSAANLPDSGSLDPGSYRINAGPYTPVDLVFKVPAGWAAGDFAVIAKNLDEPNEVGIAPDVVTHVYGDACHSDGTLAEVGPTADDLVTALVAQQNVEVEAGPSDVMIDGYRAQRLDLRYPPGLDSATCRDPDFIRIWSDETENLYLTLPTDGSASVYVADVDGERVVITAIAGPESHPEDVIERDEIIGSVRIGP